MRTVIPIDEDPRQVAYAASRARYRALVAALPPYQHPDGSPSTPFVEDPLAATPAPRGDPLLGPS